MGKKYDFTRTRTGDFHGDTVFHEYVLTWYSNQLSYKVT